MIQYRVYVFGKDENNVYFPKADSITKLRVKLMSNLQIKDGFARIYTDNKHTQKELGTLVYANDKQWHWITKDGKRYRVSPKTGALLDENKYFRYL